MMKASELRDISDDKLREHMRDRAVESLGRLTQSSA